MAKILQRERLVPNIHLIEIHSPEIARKCQPGQFVIVMPDEKGERIPLTIADWNRDRGTVTSVFMVVGTSTHKLSLLKAGDEVPVFVGPLGRPSKIEKFGTVLCAGGCFGIAAIYPIARALKEAGNKVITLLDVKANYLLYWEDRLKAVSDKFVVSSRDSFFNCKDYIPRVLGDILKKEKKVDRVISVGCTYLIYTCSEATRPKGIRTIVSLNPIMVDGTGMCGACRVTIGGKTKFACVDGPDFDGHQVDWEELFTRRKSYFEDEIDSLNYWEKINFP
ncbi:MAG: sulfide/dihydroorotate dehydrogenase-like FAD/NAD-binding protein [Candidatus Aminicenantes bacterium]|nr:sulfide/dihydroorotate dehydrogenase-like FAD/NAD-binding protein [Candidatus Aminicenantes bacterium]